MCHTPRAQVFGASPPQHVHTPGSSGKPGRRARRKQNRAKADQRALQLEEMAGSG